MLLKPVASDAKEIITHDGYSYTLRQWADFLNLPYDTLRMRYRRGLRGDELFKQVQFKERLNTEMPSAYTVKFDGQERNLSEWARHFNIGYPTLYSRYKAGKRGYDLFKPTRPYAK